MAVGPYAWSTTAASNGSADTNVNFAENQTPASLNNSARALMAGLAGWLDSIGGAGTNGGSSNAYTYTNPAVAAWASLADGNLVCIKANHTNSGEATLAVDGLEAKPIRKSASTALNAGDLVSGARYLLAYDLSGDYFQILSSGGFVQPRDATLTALAALSWDSGNALVQFTAADTISLTLTPSVSNLTLSGVLSAPDGSAAAPSVKVGDEQNGLASTAANTLNLVAAGAIRMTVGAGFITFINPAFVPDGSAGAPGLGFASDPDCGWYRIGTNNWAGAVGGSKFVDYSTTLISYSLPVQARTALSSETSGTLTSASANKRVKATGGVTINDGVFTAEDTIEIYNDSDSSITITQDTGMTLRLAGTTTTGNRTLAARGIAYVYFDTNADAAVGGSGVS